MGITGLSCCGKMGIPRYVASSSVLCGVVVRVAGRLSQANGGDDGDGDMEGS